MPTNVFINRVVPVSAYSGDKKVLTMTVRNIGVISVKGLVKQSAPAGSNHLQNI